MQTLPFNYIIDRDGALADVFSGILSEEVLFKKSERII